MLSNASFQNLQALADILVSGRPVLFITGAGLSYASGITPYRYSTNAIWSTFIVDTGKRKSFKRSPDAWWNDFWLRTHEKAEFLNAVPNAGHDALTAILRVCESYVVTQNIDGLHTKSGVPHDRLVEVHGRLGIYKCVSQSAGGKVQHSTRHDCPYSRHLAIAIDDLDRYAINGTSMSRGNLRIRVPRCPGCMAPVMPMALMFDELYVSHDFYQYPKAERWMHTAACMVFVGTSFSVNITQDAANVGILRGIPFFNFNIQRDEAMERTCIREAHTRLTEALEGGTPYPGFLGCALYGGPRFTVLGRSGVLRRNASLSQQASQIAAVARAALRSARASRGGAREGGGEGRAEGRGEGAPGRLPEGSEGSEAHERPGAAGERYGRAGYGRAGAARGSSPGSPGRPTPAPGESSLADPTEDSGRGAEAAGPESSSEDTGSESGVSGAHGARRAGKRSGKASGEGTGRGSGRTSGRGPAPALSGAMSAPCASKDPATGRAAQSGPSPASAPVLPPRAAGAGGRQPGARGPPAADPQSYGGLHLNMRWIVGPSEISLPLLKDMVFSRLAARCPPAGAADAAVAKEETGAVGAGTGADTGAEAEVKAEAETPATAAETPATATATPATPETPATVPEKDDAEVDELLRRLDSWRPSPVFDPVQLGQPGGAGEGGPGWPGGVAAVAGSPGTAGASSAPGASGAAEAPPAPRAGPGAPRASRGARAPHVSPAGPSPSPRLFARLTSADAPSAVEQLFAARNPEDGIEWAEVAEVLAQHPSPEPVRTMYCYAPAENERIGQQF